MWVNFVIPVLVIVGVPTFAYNFCKGVDKVVGHFRKD